MKRGPFRLGLTGSIGMGKSTTAAIFRAEGVPVWDADEAVARLYAPGGAAVASVAQLCPQAVRNHAVDRVALKAWLAEEPKRFSLLEAAIHPHVAADRADFLRRYSEEPLVLLDIPLLYEINAESEVDGVLVVSAPPHIQRARVLARPGMDEALFSTILARQLADSEKRKRADWVIETTDLSQTEMAVRALLEHIKDQLHA